VRTEHPAAGLRPSWRIRALITVIAVVVALTAGWPLLNLTVSDNQPLAAGERLSIGPDTRHYAQFMVGADWSVRSSESDPKQVYSLRRDGVNMTVAYVTLISRVQAAHLWAGLLNILRVSNAAARLGKPATVTDAQGSKGLTGAVTEDGFSGTATIFPDLAAGFAIEMIILAPPSAAAAGRTDAQQVVRSIRFPATRP